MIYNNFEALIYYKGYRNYKTFSCLDCSCKAEIELEIFMLKLVQPNVF